ncbi:MAG: ATP-binding cassette domain-containing protein [Rhodobacteraceae bacterium]|nr:MAG: ATP-binding cassette domain-containing protein [Paracoccaceae bacterium]
MSPETAPSKALIIDGLHVRRGAQEVLQDISLSLEPGRILALLGPNGAGKSTLVATLCGQVAPVAGQIRLGDTHLTGRKAYEIRRLGVAAVPEGHQVLSGLSVADNLAAAASMLSPREAREAVAEVLDIFPELSMKLALPAGTLSGGQQQMLSLAQALVSRPRFILADEMSFGLAPVIVKRLIPLMKRVADRGIGVLLIEQYTHLALSIADEIAVLVRGRVVAREPASAFRDRPEAIRDLYLNQTQDAASHGTTQGDKA